MRASKVVCFTTALILVAAASAHAAPNFNAGLSDGLLKFTQEITGSTYTWVFNNVSNADANPWDVIGWSVMPYNIPAPVAWEAPVGWDWTGDSFKVKSPEKYHTPPALGPGQFLTFAYSVAGDIESTEPVAMLAHVGAVTWDDKRDKWTEAKVKWDGEGKLQSWYDIPAGSPVPTDPVVSKVVPACPPPVPEPASLLLTGLGLAELIRRRRAR